MKSHPTTRRDLCYLVGKRAQKLKLNEAACAWYTLAVGMEDVLSALDIPKFNDLMAQIRAATIAGRQHTHRVNRKS